MPAQAIGIAENAGNADKLDDNRFTLPGWVAVAQAILFPVAFAIGIIERIVGKAAFDYEGPVLGPSEFLWIAFSIMGVYTLSMFRRLLKQRYSFLAIDTLLVLNIWWIIVFQVISLVLTLGFFLGRPVPEIVTAIVFGSFAVISMVSVGILDILIGIRLLRDKDQFSEMIRAFAYVSLVAGILEVSVFLSPLALFLVPVSLVILALIFLRDRKDVQFV